MTDQLYSIKKKLRTVSTNKKPPKKASNPVPEASNSRDIRIFFVNSRSVKSVRGGKQNSCRPFRNREKKSSSKIKFRVDYISRLAPFWCISRGFNFTVFIKNRENREILST